jgi:hypothetical protein
VRRAILIAISVILALTLAVPVAFGQSSGAANDDTGALGAAWWSWAASTSIDKNPLVDPLNSDGYTGGPKCDGKPLPNSASKKWFLAGTAGNVDANGVVQPDPRSERTCNVPADTELFFPIVNTLFTSEVDGHVNNQGKVVKPATNEEILAANKHEMDDFLADASYFAKIGKYDGTKLQDIPSSQIVRGASQPFPIDFYMGKDDSTFKDDNPLASFGYQGTQTAASDGLWVKLSPMKKGEKHTIVWGGDFDYEGGEFYPKIGYDPGPFSFSQDVTYHITVV